MPGLKTKSIALRTKMAILTFSSVLMAIVIVSIVVVFKMSITMEGEVEKRALSIARTLAQLDSIQNSVGLKDGARIINPIAEKTRLATGVEYIVVVDTNRVRYSHPVSGKIGEIFEGPDIDIALQDKEHISLAIGPLGPSVRALVPIRVAEGTCQKGVIVVGVLIPTLGNLLYDIRGLLISSSVIGLFVGLIGSFFLSRNIKNAMFSMEPAEIASLLEERTAIIQAMGDGIIAIDTNEDITMVNGEAYRIVGKEDNLVGMQLGEAIPNQTLPSVLQTGKPEYNQEVVVNNIVTLVNAVPVSVNNNIVGAVYILRDKTEAREMAEELTGFKAFIEALRVQNHEYMNRMHTIAGLIQLERYEIALDYIFDIAEERQEIVQFLARNINDYSVAGLLLGKYLRAKELKIDLQIDKSSSLKSFSSGKNDVNLVILIGNLLENAMDAVADLSEENRFVRIGIYDQPEGLSINVEDHGPGIPEHLREQIFERGFTTKGSRCRGIGLYLIKQALQSAGGTVRIENNLGGDGKVFCVFIPKQLSKTL